MKLTFIQWVNFPQKSNIYLWETTRALAIFLINNKHDKYFINLLKIHGLNTLYDAIDNKNALLSIESEIKKYCILHNLKP